MEDGKPGLLCLERTGRDTPLFPLPHVCRDSGPWRGDPLHLRVDRVGGTGRGFGLGWDHGVPVVYSWNTTISKPRDSDPHSPGPESRKRQGKNDTEDTVSGRGGTDSFPSPDLRASNLGS